MAEDKKPEKSYDETRSDVVKKAVAQQKEAKEKDLANTESVSISITPNASGGSNTSTRVRESAPIAFHRNQAASDAFEYGESKKAKRRKESEESEESEEQVQTADFEPTKVDADTVTDDDRARLEAHLSGGIGRDIFKAMDAADPVGTAVMTGIGALAGGAYDAMAPIVKELWSKGFDIEAKPNKTTEKMVKAQKTQFGKASKDVDDVLKHNKTYDPKAALDKADQQVGKAEVKYNREKASLARQKGKPVIDYDRKNAATKKLTRSYFDKMAATTDKLTNKTAAQDAIKTATDNLAEQGKKLIRIVDVKDMMNATTNDEILKRAKLLSETGGRAVGGAVKGAMGGALAATMFPIFMTMQKFAELGQPVPVLEFQAKAMNRPAAYHQIGPVIRRQLENDPEALQEAHDKGLMTTEAFEAFQTGADFQE
tara:strand:- start:337 stop:1617 length:1281 start_codon:yes stop_codon:yes gene_type:complete